jgi:histidyl-tRNA synthetase
MTIQRPRGTRDFNPDDMVLRRKLEYLFRSTALSFGYHEVGTPTFEDAELFIRKSGPEIVDQLYIFQDKAERQLVLRPELTAPVIRFYASELYKLPKPLKIFYFGNCFRYERPQKGRYREFWQFGAELIGTNRSEGVAELVAFAWYCIKCVGIKNFELRLGNLEILKEILSTWDIFGTEQKDFFTALDKGDLDTLKLILEDSGRTPEDIQTFFTLVQTKFKIGELKERKISLLDHFPTLDKHLARFEEVAENIKMYNIMDFTIDFSIARGLDYYTGIVFEIDVESLGAEKQVCGGGEYSLDELFELTDTPTSGFAIGFDRVALAYGMEGLEKIENELDIFIIPFSKETLKKAIEISVSLRKAGFIVDMDIKGRNMSKNLKFASNRNATFAVFIGEDELESGSALVRAMSTGDQVKVGFSDLLEYFKKVI